MFLVSHLVGDFVLQTDWQATMKAGGLGPDADRRRALGTHVATYTLAFLPALAWLADDLGGGVVLAAVAIAVPHGVQDDGRLVTAYAASVKRMGDHTPPFVRIMLDQALHVVALFALALVAGG